jgi:hypothetical protein
MEPTETSEAPDVDAVVGCFEESKVAPAVAVGPQDRLFAG